MRCFGVADVDLSCDDDTHCVVDKNSCKLYINKYNLLEIYNGVENYNYYLSKLLDELLRYKIKREEILNNTIDNINCTTKNKLNIV